MEVEQARSRANRPDGARPGWFLPPREHGAWGMLLLPYVVAAAVAGDFGAEVLTGLAAALLAFFIREPLTVLARQRWVWKGPRPESETAKRALAWEAPLLAVLGWLLWQNLPRLPLLLLALLGAALTAVAVAMAAKNRTRSLALQIVSSFALATTALLASLAAVGAVEGWAWRVWILMSLHALIGVFAVHARLEDKLKQKTGSSAGRAGAVAWTLTAAAAIAAVSAWNSSERACAPPLAISAAVAAFELRRLARAEGRSERLQRVGLRLLALSIAHAAAVVISLRWAWIED